MGWAIGSLSGGVAGAASGALADIGIDDNFIKELGDTLFHRPIYSIIHRSFSLWDSE